MGPSGRFTHVMIYWTVWDKSMQVLYLGRAPRTKETLPDFREKCWVTQHSRVFRGLTASQRTPGIGASHEKPKKALIFFSFVLFSNPHYQVDDFLVIFGLKSHIYIPFYHFLSQ